ncbi:hypothetical protein M758_12G156900, partial [Ceratodon purpureus]
MIFLDSSEGAGEEITASGGVTKVKVPTVLADSIKQEIRQELAPSEDVTEVKVRPVLPDSVKQEIGQDLARGDFERTQAQMSDLREDQEEDRICCLPSSKWRWGGPKLSSEAAYLREPLLGRDYAQYQESGLTLQRDSETDSKVSARVTAQRTQKGSGVLQRESEADSNFSTQVTTQRTQKGSGVLQSESEADSSFMSLRRILASLRK